MVIYCILFVFVVFFVDIVVTLIDVKGYNGITFKPKNEKQFSCFD